MDNHKIEAILFDLGNVLVDFDHTRAAKKISQFSAKTPDEIFNLFFDSPLTGLFEEGKISPFDFFLKVKEMLNLKLDYDGFVPIWNDIFFLTEKNHAVYHLANRLKPNYKIALISNINILHFTYLKKKFPVFDAFHNLFTSYEMGAIKPNPAIYKRALSELEVMPERVFYTDDRAELVESAKILGMRGFVFKNVEQLKKDILHSGANIN